MVASRPEPHLFIVLGATGDLMRRKLLPALHRLAVPGYLEGCCTVLGVARRDYDDVRFRQWALEVLPAETAARRWCQESLHFQSAQEGVLADYRALADRIVEIERDAGLPGNRVFYLALPPAGVPEAVRCLGEAGLAEGPGWTRLVIEKPFGRDLVTAQGLNELLHRYFDESQVYRIDHYLGKETVKNLMVFRFANAIFESQWNRDHIANVQITVAEALGVEGRGASYEQSGALRDMVQSHLTQLVTLMAMEPPVAFEAEEIRYEKTKVLRAIAPILPEDVVFGQYDTGEVCGAAVAGYREEYGVTPDSQVETFAALRLNIDTWRWQGVPFYVRTGKRLPRRVTQIAVTFRRPPVCLFQSFGACRIHSNVLVMTLQPDEGFALYFDVKAPGQEMALDTLPLRFHYSDVFGDLPDAYHTLLLDVLRGDQTLFVHAAETEASWHLYSPLLDQDLPVQSYPAGTWGPHDSDRLLNRDGNSWFMA